MKKSLRLIAFFLLLVVTLTAIPVSAAEPHVEINVSKSRCTNYSTLPSGITESHVNTPLYINVIGNYDTHMKHFSILMHSPDGQTTTIANETAGTFYRWYYSPINLQNPGKYQFEITITLVDGRQAHGTINHTVKEEEAANITNTLGNSKPILIKSKRTGKYVQVKSNGSVSADVDRNSATHFLPHVFNDGWLALECEGQGKYLSARKDENGSPIKTATVSQSYECFQAFLYKGNYYLACQANQLLVEADASGRLSATGSKIGTASEFAIEPVTRIQFDWDAKGKTSETRSSADKLTIVRPDGSQVTITPGDVFYTYTSNGNPSTGGYDYYIKMPDGSLRFVGGAQCLGAAYWIQNLYYDKDSHLTVLKNTPNTDDGKTSFYGYRINKRLDAASLKTLLLSSPELTHLRCASGAGSHSIILLRAEESGFYYFDANTGRGNNVIRMGYTTYGDFCEGGYGYIRYIEIHHE